MNQIVGHTEVGGNKYPILSGPCKGCGATNYGISTSGPDYCGACACGVPPEVSKLRRELEAERTKCLDMHFAIGILSGWFPPFNEHVRKRGQDYLDKLKSEWLAKHPKTEN